MSTHLEEQELARKFLSKCEFPVHASKRPKTDPCAPMATLISVFPDRHGCGFAAEETEPCPQRRQSEASKSRDTLAEAAPTGAFSPKAYLGEEIR